MKVAILGAAGVIGQHMRLCVPKGVEPVWVRQKSDLLHVGLDLTDKAALDKFLDETNPDAIVNLAGENRPDVVEQNPELFEDVNIRLPKNLATWCFENKKRFVQVSTQAVFSGNEPPYSSTAERNPVNAYGKQKKAAEDWIKYIGGNYAIVRPTFILGVRPMSGIGRKNPIELFLSQGPQKQVNDRWFSVSFAWEVAKILWEEVMYPNSPKVSNFGYPERVSRYDLACKINKGNAIEAKTEDFPGIAPRPVDTTYLSEQINRGLGINVGLGVCSEMFNSREALSPYQRAKELAIFFNKYEEECMAKLFRGFLPLHNEVTEDFKRANAKDNLLGWYRNTESYIWELSAYHTDPGFNYNGMITGIADALESKGVKTVLCLGDGIGDLTLLLAKRGFQVTYHDLRDSKTYKFAETRFYMYGVHPSIITTDGWNPPKTWEWMYDAVVSLDFMEHLPNVEKWVQFISESLSPGGYFVAQNAFACGSGFDGPIPMHLAENDHYEKDWDPLLSSLGFEQLSSNWYQKPICCNVGVGSQGDLVHEKECPACVD